MMRLAAASARSQSSFSASDFSSQKSVSEHLKLACVRLALRAAERIDRRSDANLHKPAIFDHFLPGCTRQTAGNSSRPKIYVGNRSCGYLPAVGDVSKLQMATWT